MVPYTLTILCVCVAGAIHWMSPKAYWKATLMSTAVILLFSVAALFIFQASGMLVSEQTGENALCGGLKPDSVENSGKSAAFAFPSAIRDRAAFS